MSKYGDDIRVISRYNELIKLITKAQNSADQAEKDAIAAQRAITYITNSNSVITAAVKGAVGVLAPTSTAAQDAANAADVATGADAAGDGSASAANSAVQNSGGTSGLDSNPVDNTSRDGFYDAQSLLNSEKDAYGKVPPEAGAIDAASQIVRSLTGLKDSDGNTIIAHLVDAAKQFFGPNNWNGALSPGIDPTYVAGQTWTLLTGSSSLFANSFNGLLGLRMGVDGSTAYNYAGGSVQGVPEAGSDVIFSGITNAPIGSHPGGTVYAFEAYSPGATISAGHYGAEDCGLLPGDAAACSAAPPLQASWSDLGFTQLGWITPLTGGISPYSYLQAGKFIASVYDQYAEGKYHDGMSTLNLLTDPGNQAVTIQPLSNGGLAMFYSATGSPSTPTGDATAYSIYTLGNDRSPTGFITPSQYVTMLPK